MNTTVINIRTNVKLKSAAQKVAEALGLNLSALINGYLKNLVKTKAVFFSTSEEPSNYLIQAIKEAREERRKGKYHSFNNATEALAFLNKKKRKK